MAKSYTLIQAQTLTATTASVTFSNIPQNYTDLILKVSARATSTSGTSRAIQLQINGDTTYANYRERYIRTDDTGAAQSGAFLSSTGVKYYFYGLPNANATASSFGAAELTFINYAGSSYKTFSAEAFAEGFHNPFTGTAGNSVTAALWVNTAAITTLVLNPDDSSFAAGSTFYLYGVGGTRATGGTITSDKDFTYHTFTSTGTFTALEKIKNAEVLLIAGGGASTGTVLNGYATPGGGAGGLVYAPAQTFFAGTSYTALVGAGGAAGASGNTARGGNGGDSQFGSVTRAVGGGGGGCQDVGVGRNGAAGGSGGGSFLAVGGTATSGQGNAGGNGASDHPYLTTGGGGAGEVGGIGVGDQNSGKGGNGLSSYTQWGLATATGELSNGTYYYAGGGAGGIMQVTSSQAGAGGLGGGGSNTISANGKTNGTANTGGGASGVNGYAAATAGASGGSGLVIVRYPSN